MISSSLAENPNRAGFKGELKMMSTIARKVIKQVFYIRLSIQSVTIRMTIIEIVESVKLKCN